VVLKMVFEDVREAVTHNTFDELADRHLTRTPMVVDSKGWQDVASLLADAMDRILEIQAEASERLTNSGEEGMLSKVEILHFKSPQPTETPQAGSKKAESPLKS
jgi:hypothetical protein